MSDPNPLGGGCPVASDRISRSGEPPEIGEHSVVGGELGSHESVVEGYSKIPAAGRGNSEDGKYWLNPSPGQLYRALARKNKAIDPQDSEAVAFVHQMVTKQTWDCILEYESLHARRCNNPRLERFVGKDGIYSYKARMVQLVRGVLPFDRHDWTVNRCGKEVRYIIDYYAVPDPKHDIAYFIDARPALTFSGIKDRFHLAFKKWRNGQSFW